MSITFTPFTGTWTAYHYALYGPDDADHGAYSNGVARYSEEEPSINMANGNAYWFFNKIGHPLPDCCGELTVTQLIAIRTACVEVLNEFDAPSEQVERYARTFIRIANHCVYHNCSVTYG